MPLSAGGQFDAWAGNFADIINELPETYRMDSDEIKEFGKTLTV
ncbi:hypothetical protein [Fuerstiella marisgermanici]|uniref:Uncharacterized protein n=1 Tax=Fuerstiella marisgermanici TaxID=1891926 RepID=A0A1P8WAH7_9PLAN|nr:hypothetical protein [Fuerstiella marisgermanici]APZ91066.1 hypothetical protein Fuma_00652 [Fuerstiella marisgermanici]